MLRFFEKKVFGVCKSQIFFVGDQNGGRGDRMAEAWKSSERHKDSFAGRSFCKSGGLKVIFVGLMAPLHLLPRLSCLCEQTVGASSSSFGVWELKTLGLSGNLGLQEFGSFGTLWNIGIIRELGITLELSENSGLQTFGRLLNHWIYLRTWNNSRAS